MTEAARIAHLGAVLASESRVALLCALMGGTAHTPTELARHLGLAGSTVSEHLGVLLDAGLVAVAAQGRHRYVRLAGERTADLLEHLGVVAALAGSPSSPRVPAALAYARSCYGHLAGELGVRLHDALVTSGVVAGDEHGHRWVTDAGRVVLDRAGVVVVPRAGRALVRPCLDWTARRDHLAGAVGDALLRRAVGAGWLRRHPTQPRALRLTDPGRDAFADAFELELP